MNFRQYARRMSFVGTPIDAAVRREMLRMALINSTRSVPLQIAGIAFFVGLGMEVEMNLIAALVGLLRICRLGLSGSRRDHVFWR